MMSRRKIICFLLLSLTGANHLAARSLTISAPDWPPFYIHDSDNPDHRGLAWDIVSSCVKSLAVDAEYEMYPIRRMFRYMELGELDLNIMSYKADRAKSVEFGKEIVFENSYGVWTSGSYRRQIRSIADLRDASIAQLIGLRPSDEFKAFMEERLARASENPDSQKDTLVVNDPDQIVKMLASGRIDATVASVAEISWRARRLGLQNKIRFSGLVVQKQKYFFVVSRSSPYTRARPDLTRRMDQCVKELKKNGRMSQIHGRYKI